MLAIRVEPGQNLDKSLASASSSLKALIKTASDEGILRIVAAPSSESIMSLLMVFSILSRRGVNVVASVSPKPPSTIYEPTLLLGFPSPLGYTNDTVKDQLVLISQGTVEPPPLNASYVSCDGSIGACAYMILKGANQFSIEPEYAVLSISSSYASNYMDKAGKVSGLDKILTSSLAADEKVSLFMLTSLKGYRAHILDLCESIKITVDPFYPGLTGTNYCVELLESNGAGELAMKKPSSMDEEELGAAAKIMLSYLKDRLKRQLDVKDFVGGVYLASEKLIITDPKEALNLVEFASDTWGLQSAIALTSNYDEEYPQAVSQLKAVAETLTETIDNARLVDLGPLNGVKVYSIKDLSERAPLQLLWRALKLLGYVDQHSYIAVESDGGLLLSMPQVYESTGHLVLQRLSEFEGAEVRGVRLWLPRSQK